MSDLPQDAVRPISTEGFTPIKGPVEPGAAPLLQWIKIADMVVDPSYQRPISGIGVRNIAKIAGSFQWSCFTPVVVSPVAGGRFAIVDGQHRTTAAALCGIESVPCQVIMAGRDEQANAFKAINGTTTKVTRIALHAAAVVGGDDGARALQEVCAAAGVEILRYPVPTNLQKPGQTMAIGCLVKCLAQYGRDTLITAMQCVTETANHETPGLLCAPMIQALCDTLHGRPEWRDAGEVLFEIFDDIDLPGLIDAVRAAPRMKGMSVAAALAPRITTALTEAFDRREAA